MVSTMTGTAGMDPTLMERLEAEREEITKVKNIPSIQFGRWDIEAWYYGMLYLIGGSFGPGKVGTSHYGAYNLHDDPQCHGQLVRVSIGSPNL